MRNTPLRLRVLSAATALALISSCSLPAFAGQYYLEDGDITVVAGEDGNDVTQNDKTTKNDKNTTISNRDSSKATDNTVTIRADGDKTADVTLKDTNIEAKDSSAVRAEGTGTVRIELDGQNKLTGGTDEDGKGYAGLEKKNNYTGGEVSEVGYKDGTLIIKDDDNNGKLIAQGTGNSAGIGGSEDKAGDSNRADNAKCSHNIEIDGGDITANGSGGGAGIGGAENGFGKVTIKGGSIEANGGMEGGAGIGGGKADGWSGLGEVSISGGHIEANGGANAAGIGGGKGGDAHVTISGGTITANGGDDAAAIGTGANTSYDNSYVKISDGTVTANGGEIGEGDGSGLGGDNAEVKISGGTITVKGTGSAAAIRGNTVNISADDSNLELTVVASQGDLIKANNKEDTILALGERHSASAVFSSNNDDGKRVHNNAKGHDWVAVTDSDAESRGFIVYECSCGERYEVPKNTANHEHSWDLGIVTKHPTELEEGVRTYHCHTCSATYTEPIAKLAHEHTWVETERVEPTYTEEGYVLYTCRCGGSQREILPQLERSDDSDNTNNGDDTPDTPDTTTTESESITAWYRVANGAQDYTTSCQPQIAGDTCTFTTDLENATLSGNFAYLQQLYAQGVRTLCFVTANRTTRLSLDALLARGEEESVFALAHTGADAALTVDGQVANELLG